MKTLSLALLALLGAGAVPADAAAAEGVVTRAPAVTTPAQPVYPAEARAEGLTGAVTLLIDISEAGQVTDAVVTGPAGHGFDEAALEAARRLVFSPAEIDGKPAAVRIEYRYDFSLTAAPAAETSPPVNLRGRVLEMGTRLPVVAAEVRARPSAPGLEGGPAVAPSGASTFTDKDGRFALSVPLGEVKVVVSDPAHARFEATETIDLGKATLVTYWLRRTALADAETVVTGKRERREVSQTAITPGEIRRIAGVSGDTVKVVLNLPGVARSPFGAGQLVVRGGNPRDTRTYVDGLQVPDVFHFGGLYSIYTAELVKQVDFSPGNFGVTSGRAIGGRVEIVTRDPADRPHAVGDVNLYQGTAFWEGPAGDKLRLALAVRRSWVGELLAWGIRRAKDGPGVVVAPRFYDAQGKAVWKLSTADTLRLDAFGSDDKVLFTGVDAGELTNESAARLQNQFYKVNLRFEHRFSDEGRLLLAAGGGWQRAVNQFGDHFMQTVDAWSSVYRAELRQRLLPWLELTVGGDAEWDPSVRVKVTAGALDLPGQISSGIADRQVLSRFNKAINGYEGGVFAEATVQPVEWLRLVPGLRADVSRSLGTLSWIDPRLGVRAQLDEKTALKGAAGLYHQAPPAPYLTREWGNPDLAPEQAWQYSVGVERKLLPQLSLDVELYYKRLTRLALPTSAVVTRGGEQVPLHFVSAGSGKSYGAEVLLRWESDGRFFGWIAYSLSRSLRDQSPAGGRLESEGSAYDQPHNLVAVGTVELPELWEGLSAGFRLRFTSGNPYRRVQGAVYDADADAYQSIAETGYGGRMPSFFQLDLRIDKKKTYRLWSLTTYLEVQNVTMHENPEFPAYNFDYSKKRWVTGIPIFPAFGVRAEY